MTRSRNCRAALQACGSIESAKVCRASESRLDEFARASWALRMLRGSAPSLRPSKSANVTVCAYESASAESVAPQGPNRRHSRATRVACFSFRASASRRSSRNVRQSTARVAAKPSGTTLPSRSRAIAGSQFRKSRRSFRVLESFSGSAMPSRSGANAPAARGALPAGRPFLRSVHSVPFVQRTLGSAGHLSDQSGARRC